MTITPVEILISLNLLWITLSTTLATLVYKSLKARIIEAEKRTQFLEGKLDEFEKDYVTDIELGIALNGIGKRIDSEIKQEDLKASACRGDVSSKIGFLENKFSDFIEGRFMKFILAYSKHVHAKESGKVEGGDFI